jgi:hypothetical protein
MTIIFRQEYLTPDGKISPTLKLIVFACLKAQKYNLCFLLFRQNLYSLNHFLPFSSLLHQLDRASEWGNLHPRIVLSTKALPEVLRLRLNWLLLFFQTCHRPSQGIDCIVLNSNITLTTSRYLLPMMLKTTRSSPTKLAFP